MADEDERDAADQKVGTGGDAPGDKDTPPGRELRADRETNYAQGSWIGGGRAQTMLSAERLSDAFKSDPTHDPRHDDSWRTHEVEEDEPEDRHKPPENGR